MVSSPLIQVPAASCASQEQKRPPTPIWGGPRDLGICSGALLEVRADRHGVAVAPRSWRGCRGGPPACPGEAAPLMASRRRRLHHSASGEHDEAPRGRVAATTPAHAVPARPPSYPLGRERAVVGTPLRGSASPGSSASGVFRSCSEAGTTATVEPVAVGVQPAAPPRRALGLIVPARAADADTLHFTIWVPTTPKGGPNPARPRRRRATSRGVASSRLRLQPAPEPTEFGPSRRPACRPPSPARECHVIADHAPDRRRASVLRRVGHSCRRSPLPAATNPFLFPPSTTARPPCIEDRAARPEPAVRWDGSR